EPLDLLAFLKRRSAIADHQRDRGQHGAGEVDELAEEAERRYAGHLACDADNRACERNPGERPPAWRDRLTIGEKEGQEKEREDHRRDPYPAGQPLPKIRVGNSWVWGVGGVAGEAQDEFLEPPQDADPAAYPPDPVPWPPPDDQCADDGEGHREDRGQPKVLLGGTRQWREVGVGGVTKVGSRTAENNRGHCERPAKPDPDSCRMGVRHRGHQTPHGSGRDPAGWAVGPTFVANPTVGPFGWPRQSGPDRSAWPVRARGWMRRRPLPWSGAGSLAAAGL